MAEQVRTSILSNLMVEVWVGAIKVGPTTGLESVLEEDEAMTTEFGVERWMEINGERVSETNKVISRGRRKDD